jgi:3-oxocholest-4-en-26-oate---CoA ligase
MSSSTRHQWNFADAWEAAADRFPDRIALVHGDVEIDWATFDRHADGYATTLLGAGLGRQAKVAQYLRNGPAYLESLFGCFKAGLVPVNTNYRYGDDELVYLWTNSEAEAVVFDAEFTEICERLRHQLPDVRCWIRVGDGGTPLWAVDDHTATSSASQRVVPRVGRSGDDLYLLYTGGTTGLPKGVMWRQDDLFRMLEAPRGPWADRADSATGFVAALRVPDPPVLPAPPLMHGTACWFCMPVLSRAGTVVTLTNASLDVEELLDTVEHRRVVRLCIVGDAFARPILRALDADPHRWDLSSLQVVFSSGAVLSPGNKRGLLEAAPNAIVVDGLGSSESGSLATSITGHRDEPAAARFALSESTRVLDENGRDVVPGTGQVGRLAVGGHLPLGYYGDPVKTASTFVDVEGRRFVIAGDQATVEADGSISLLGRGSSCINTAGEKVFPEEVEQVLCEVDSVRDAAVVGVPDERFGERVVALIEPHDGADVVAEDMIAFVKSRLASYKAPREVVVVDSVHRGPNGKLDHRRLRELAQRMTNPG